MEYEIKGYLWNMNNIKKYLDFYMVYCKWEYDESWKYHGYIDHIFYPKEDMMKLEDIGFGKKVEDYSEITSINPIQLMFSFIPNKRYLRFIRKDIRPMIWTKEFSGNISDSVLMEYDDITLDDCVLYIKEEKRFELTSEELIIETNKIDDVWIEKIIGNRLYVDMDKVIKKINKILYDDLGFKLDFKSFITLLGKGEISGKEINRINREYK